VLFITRKRELYYLPSWNNTLARTMVWAASSCCFNKVLQPWAEWWLRLCEKHCLFSKWG